MEELYTWIRNIIIYMIMNTIIMNLLGNKSYKKYASIASGMILVIIVIQPLIKYMKLEDNLDYYLKANDFAIETSDFKNDVNRMEEAQQSAIFEEYKQKIKKQINAIFQEDSLTVTDFRITINQDAKSVAFGEIQSMEITAAKDNNDLAANRLQIDDIEIKSIEIEDEEESEETIPTPMEIKMKNKLSDFYNIEQGNINISIQGG